MPRLVYQISIIYPTDPLGPGVGGIKTFIKDFIKYASEDFGIQFIGISSNYKERPSKKWTRISLGDRKFDFFPLFFEKDENRKTLIPLSLRFTLALKFSNVKVDKKLLFFNRIEPALVFKKLEAPKIGVIHNDIIRQLKKGKSEAFWSKFPWLYFMFENFIFSFIDIVYTVNKNTLKFYQSRYSEQKEKFLFIPTWVDTKIFYPINKSKEKIRHNLLMRYKRLALKAKWILFVGRLQKQKALLRLIQTFAEYRKIDKDSYLLIVGEGNLKRDIKNYVRELGLEQSVYFMGFKNQEELAEFYRAADVMLLTSNYEGMPRCVLEALGSGLPVVSTDVGEVKMVINNGLSGEVVESDSPLNISQSLKKVINNPNMYSKDNCLKSVSKYTPQKVLEPVYEMIRELHKKMTNINV